MTDTDRNTIGAVLGRIPSGLAIVTVRGPNGAQTGMLASWFQQVSFDPPALSIAVKQGRYINDWLAADGALAVNLLGEGQKSFLSHFGKGFGPDEEAFSGIETSTGTNGVTVLTQALGWLEGRVTQRLDVGDHALIIAEITAAGRGPDLDAVRPTVHIRRNGFNY